MNKYEKALYHLKGVQDNADRMKDIAEKRSRVGTVCSTGTEGRYKCERDCRSGGNSGCINRHLVLGRECVGDSRVRSMGMGEMIKTSDSVCRKCKYSSIISDSSTVICNYYLDTKKRRGCPLGVCDKYEARKKNQRRSGKEKERG